MIKKFVVALALGAGILAGCQPAPTDNQIVVAGTQAIRLLGQQVDRAERLGVITREEEIAYIQELLVANDLLRVAEALFDSCEPPCSAAAAKLEEVDRIMGEIERKLLEAEK